MPDIKGKIQRKFMAHYLDASMNNTQTNYVRLGADLEEYNVEMNPNVEKKNNILGEVSVTLDSYQPQASVTPYYAVKGDKMFETLQAIIDDRKVLDDLQTTSVEVQLWNPVSEEENTFVAYRDNAIVEVTSYGGNTTGYQIPFNVHLTGGRVKGKFNVSTKTFTAE